MSINRKLYLVDDRSSEAEEYEELIEMASDGLRIERILPTEQKEDIGVLVSDEDTGGFIIDQRLDEAVSYDGTDLAAYLRAIRKEIPLFMLTSYPSEVDDHQSDGAVDNVFDKSMVRLKAGTVAKRIERRMGQYEEALSTSLARMRDLLDKQAISILDDREAAELSVLCCDIERPIDARLAKSNIEDEARQKRESELIGRLELLATKLEKGGTP